MRITRVFFDVYMGYGFDGLNEIVKDAKAKVTEETNLIFVNRRGSAFKMLRGRDFLVYYKAGDKRKIPLDALRYLPTQFGGTDLEMDAAIKKSLLEELGGGAI